MVEKCRLTPESGCAAYYCAVKTLMDAGWRPRGDVILTYVVGELQGGPGTVALIEEGVCKADYFVNCEPSDLKAITTHASSQVFRIELTGVTRQYVAGDTGLADSKYEQTRGSDRCQYGSQQLDPETGRIDLSQCQERGCGSLQSLLHRCGSLGTRSRVGGMATTADCRFRCAQGFCVSLICGSCPS